MQSMSKHLSSMHVVPSTKEMICERASLTFMLFVQGVKLCFSNEAIGIYREDSSHVQQSYIHNRQ